MEIAIAKKDESIAHYMKYRHSELSKRTKYDQIMFLKQSIKLKKMTLDEGNIIMGRIHSKDN